MGMIVDEEQEDADDEAVNDAAAGFGLTPIYERQRAEPLYLWPECVNAWNFFQAVSTQWVVGQGGAVGLNYQGVAVVRDAWGIRRKDWPKLFSEVQAMERATLSGWSERKK